MVMTILKTCGAVLDELAAARGRWMQDPEEVARGAVRWVDFDRGREREGKMGSVVTALERLERYGMLHLWDDGLMVRVQVASRTPRFGVGVEVDWSDGEVTISLRGPVSVYLTAGGKAVGPVVEAMGLAPRWGKRSVDLAVHDGAVWWKAWVDPDSWEASRPRWRDGNLNLVELVLGEEVTRTEKGETREVVIPMPEAVYAGKAERTTVVRTFARIAGLWEQRFPRMTVSPWRPVPVPGKGESAHDCGLDATYSISVPASTVEEGVGAFVAGVLETRRRREGSWLAGTNEARSGDVGKHVAVALLRHVMDQLGAAVPPGAEPDTAVEALRCELMRQRAEGYEAGALATSTAPTNFRDPSGDKPGCAPDLGPTSNELPSSA